MNPMEIVELLNVDAVVPNMKAASKKQVLQELAARAARLTDSRYTLRTCLPRSRSCWRRRVFSTSH